APPRGATAGVRTPRDAGPPPPLVGVTSFGFGGLNDQERDGSAHDEPHRLVEPDGNGVVRRSVQEGKLATTDDARSDDPDQEFGQTLPAMVRVGGDRADLGESGEA